MLDYGLLREIWWVILGVALIGFAIADGFDMGVAAIYRFVARGEEERRAMLAAVEPVWEGNQVWFIVAGAGAFAAWPLVYAVSFSGLYLAMFLILVAFILRPVGFNFRDKLSSLRWRNAWDWALFVGGVLPPLLFGVAFGNLFLGLPFHFDELRRVVYTGSFWSLLHPFALLCGVVSLSMIVMHGAAFAASKTGEPMAARAARVGRLAALVYLLAFLAAGVLLALEIEGPRIMFALAHDGPSNPVGNKHVLWAAGHWLENFHRDPVLWLAPLLAVVAAITCRTLLGARDRSGSAFLASSFVQAATILTAGVALFPFLLPSSTYPGQGLTVWDSSSSQMTLQVMLLAALVFLPLVLVYTTWVYHVLRGRVTLDAIREHGNRY